MNSSYLSGRSVSTKPGAIQFALSSGLSRTCVATDLGIGKSALAKWIVDYRPDEPVSGYQADLACENERLRLENRILREEREILKKLPSSSRVKSHEVRLHPWTSARMASRETVPCLINLNLFGGGQYYRPIRATWWIEGW